MKRETALHPLSHQHHNALTGCLLIKKGIQKKADKKVIGDFTSRLWKDDLIHHLEVEEKFLFPYLDRFDKNYHKMMKADHERLRVLAQRLDTHQDGYTLYSALATLVEQHIRFEERVIYNKMQDNLSPEELNDLGKSLEHVQPKKCSDYPIKFWE